MRFRAIDIRPFRLALEDSHDGIVRAVNIDNLAQSLLVRSEELLAHLLTDGTVATSLLLVALVEPSSRQEGRVDDLVISCLLYTSRCV